MIPAYIMAVPWELNRVKRAKQLRAATEGTIVWDQKHNVMDTFRLLLQRVVDDGNQAFFLLQDDVILTEDWRTKVERVVSWHPNQVCQFFSMEKAESARELGSRECLGAGFISNLCVYLPKGMASDLLEHSYTYVEKHPENATADDFVIRDLLKLRKEKYWLQVPSLVQHEELWKSSVNAKRTSRRKSHFWDGEV